MERKISNFLNFLNKGNTPDPYPGKTIEPQLGFKISYSEKLGVLNVKVIGAKQLPTDYGVTKARGYVVKVTVFPIKEKFETKPVTGNWPTINEEFAFSLNVPDKKPSGDWLKGKFVSFTIYATLEESCEEEKPNKSTRSGVFLKRFFSFDENSEFLRRNVHRSFGRRSFRTSMKDRRTIGAVTYNLERKNFSQHLKDNVISTPDVWRSVKEIASGIQTQPREGKKGSIELTLQYAVSEDGRNDVVEVTVTKFRCSLQTMQEHERVGGQLYIKINAYESDDIIQKTKSDRFNPTISLKMEANSATLRATVNNYMLNKVKIVIRLLSRNILGKKTLLGKIEINRDEAFWKEIVATPGVPVTKMVNFE
ncbi:uncharacterized protein LOC126740785 [Anthonomus grandis grandis]|uniref:uncharacterized protein LOC126740785 n=1 Tax=Anthonomus grandis grandis TaxID=2921223 RepID=UPI00216639D3|nr:uncharacterized protein LOC126740785 [Anthonomus grandis grandis]